MTIVISWIVFGLLVGSLGTYLLYLDRMRSPDRGALVGGLLGAVGNLLVLIPWWVYIYLQGRQGDAAELEERAPLETRHFVRIGLYAVLLLVTIMYLIPVYTVITTSLKTPQEAGKLSQVWNLPSTVEWSKYQPLNDVGLKIPLPDSYVVALETFGPYLKNSFILTITATIVSAVMGSMNGYVLSKWRFPGANVIFPLMLFGMFIPYQSILIPLFDFIRRVNLGGTLYGLIIAHVVYGLPITTLIFRNYYAEVPTEMIEAGAIDGAGFFGIYRWIVFPLSLPGFVVVIIWQFTQIWNEFLFAVTLTNQKTYPITVKLAELAGGEAVNWNLPMAGAILAALPTLLVYIVLGRYFIRGLLAGSVKG